MSKEQAIEFLKKSKVDKTTAGKVEEIFRAALAKAGKDAGFNFNREDLDEALVEMKAQISEGELNAVAGGLGTQNTNIDNETSTDLTTDSSCVF